MGIEAIPYEQAAEKLTNLEGWVCKKCKRFFGKDEHTARYCCAKDLPCRADGCDGRTKSRGWLYCQPCLDKRDLKKFLAREEVDWDEETPLVEHDNDRYFFDADDLWCEAEDRGVKPWDMMLVTCVKRSKPTFNMYDLFEDYLCEDQELLASATKIEKHINGWIQANAPIVWIPGKQRISEKSLRKIFPE